MQLIRQAGQMAHTARALRRQGTSVGFVPTMGALHDGHGSLIRAARKEARRVVVSIFVNPLQFGPQEDYERYPRDLKRDLKLAKAWGADVIFAPHASQMYPAGFSTTIDLSSLTSRLEGTVRPGHFQGVLTVVTKLFLLVQPTVVYFGQKDYQQAVLIQRLIKELDFDIAFRLMPTVREADGLAMSSRNVYLDPAQRQAAPVLFKALTLGKDQLKAGQRQVAALVEAMRHYIEEDGQAQIEYLDIVHAKTLEPLTEVTGRVALLGSIQVGATRLIDNLLVDVP